MRETWRVSDHQCQGLSGESTGDGPRPWRRSAASSLRGGAPRTRRRAPGGCPRFPQAGGCPPLRESSAPRQPISAGNPVSVPDAPLAGRKHSARLLPSNPALDCPGGGRNPLGRSLRSRRQGDGASATLDRTRPRVPRTLLRLSGWGRSGRSRAALASDLARQEPGISKKRGRY